MGLETGKTVAEAFESCRMKVEWRRKLDTSTVYPDCTPDPAARVRGSRGGVTFATLHIVGSNNNRPTDDRPSIGNEEEYQARNAANIEWLKGTFDEARKNDSPAVMLVIQANIFEEDDAEPSGFAEFKKALEEETAAFGKPVVLVHGDSHTFRIDKPRISDQRLLNFTRVETFVSPDVHWVRASVDTRDPEVFTSQPEIVEKNLAIP